MSDDLIPRILRLLQSGLVARWYEEHLQKDPCSITQDANPAPMSLNDSLYIFLFVLGVGLSFSTLCLVIEIFVHKMIHRF